MRRRGDKPISEKGVPKHRLLHAKTWPAKIQNLSQIIGVWPIIVVWPIFARGHAASDSAVIHPGTHPGTHFGTHSGGDNCR
jgi:hypothetical protein